MPGLGLSIVGLLAIAVLVLANAYFVATEFALVAVRRSQLAVWVRENRRGAAAAMRAVEHLDDAIAATQLGITLASIGLGFLGEPAVAALLRPGLSAAGLGTAAVHSVAFVVGFTVVFAILGAYVGLVGNALQQHLETLTRIGGVLLMVFGMQMSGLINIPFPERTYQLPAR